MTLLAPSSTVVVIGWLTLAAPGLRVDRTLPATDTALRTDGFLVPRLVGGTLGRDVPDRSPVFDIECWVAPDAAGTGLAPWNQAEDLAQRVVDATYDPALMHKALDLSALGNYGPAHVQTVVALGVRQGPDDPSNYARFDVTAQFTWIGA